MFRIIFGFTLSTICGLSICVAFISFAGDNINQSQLGGMILGSLVLSIPGWLLCYSGGQSLKSKKVLKASLKMLQDDNSIDVDKISSLTGRNKSKAIKDIIRGQKKGIIPTDIEIVISSKIVKDKWLNKGYIAIDDKLKQPDTLNKKEIQAEFYKPISEQEELEFWTTFLEYGLQGILEKHLHLYRQMIDFSHKEPSISNSIPNDLKIEIKKQWEIEKIKDTITNNMIIGLLVIIGLILLIIVY